MGTMASTIEHNATRIRELHERMRETFRLKPHGAEHHAACEEFHRRYDELAFPGGLKQGLALLGKNDSAAVAAAVAFLVADPRFFRSGYIKETILRRLKHVTLSKGHGEKLVRLAIASLDRGGRREYHGYARLAGALQCPALAQAAQARRESPDGEVRRRALEMLHVMQSHRTRQGGGQTSG
ncbi:MAG: hypothetical protein NTV86_21855 [Planctomycetota bacterium]|nr:hypothetical protein [Planctomycetota bacterium]